MGAKEQKQLAIDSIKDSFERAQSVVLTDYRGLNVAQVTELRSRLRASGIEYKVLKNTLTKRALDSIELSGLDDYLRGPTAIAFSYDDPVAPAKVLNDFSKENDKLEIKAGVLEGKVIDMNRVKELAALPSREQLLSMVVRGMQAPMANFAGGMSALLRSFAYAVNAVKDQKEAAGS